MTTPLRHLAGKAARFALTATAVLVVAVAIADQANHDHGLPEDARAPALTYMGPDGNSRSVTDSGHPVVVNFWATWCPPCRAELPDLAATAKKHEGRVDFVGVAVQSEPALAKAMAERYGLTYPIVFGSPTTQMEWQVSALPTTFVLDKEGKVVWARAGMVDGRTLDEVLGPLTGDCADEVC